MNAFQRKVALRVLGIHVAFILLLAIFSGLKGCFRRKPKPEIVTFIDFGPAAPPVAVEQVDQMSEPDPVEAPPSEPEPVKVPDPVRIPDEPKKVIKPPKKIEQPKPKPVEPKPKVEKPKWKPTKVDPTKSKVIKPVKPRIDPSKINLSDVQEKRSTPTQTPGPVGNPNADAAYISQITSFFDRRWNHPANASPSSSVIVRIYISKWGTITKRQKIQGSGDAAFDQSVMAVVNSEKTVAKPPANYSYEYVEVEFRIRN